MNKPPRTFEFNSEQEWDAIEVWIYDNPNYILVLFHHKSQTYVLCDYHNSVYIDITDIHRILVDGGQVVWVKNIVFSKPENAQITRVKTLSEVKEILKHQLTLALL